MRALIPFLLLVIASAPVYAQTSSQNAAKGLQVERDQLSNTEQKSGRTEQKTERIHLEDKGSTVDELRIGGQTRSITVQPAAQNMPEYEVQPSDGVRNRPRNGAESTTGPRVWNVMKF